MSRPRRRVVALYTLIGGQVVLGEKLECGHIHDIQIEVTRRYRKPAYRLCQKCADGKPIEWNNRNILKYRSSSS